MKNILILHPRLDVSFKEGPVPEKRGPIEPIRVHWFNFINSLYLNLIKRGHDTRILEAPLWQLTEDVVEQTAKELGSDVVFVPHREKREYTIDGLELLYYHQTVFSDRFTIDPVGYAGGASKCPLEPKADLNAHNVFRRYQYRINKGVSKFDYLQPSKEDKFFEKDYILFACQIPHDTVIKYHSDVSVCEALQATIDFAKRRGEKVIVKGHPVNPSSMYQMKQITRENSNSHWVDKMNIHQAIENSKMVVSVNSGTGWEALLMEKPVVTFGDSEYEKATYRIRREPGKTLLDTMDETISKNPVFFSSNASCIINQFHSWTFDSANIDDFNKLVI